LKIALAMAGATTVTPGSPQPEAGWVLEMIETSISGKRRPMPSQQMKQSADSRSCPGRRARYDRAKGETP
jgi:hypothetical protein